MSDNKEVSPVEVDKLSFNENGEVVGLDDQALADVAGGAIGAGEEEAIDVNIFKCRCGVIETEVQA